MYFMINLIIFSVITWFYKLVLLDENLTVVATTDPNG